MNINLTDKHHIEMIFTLEKLNLDYLLCTYITLLFHYYNENSIENIMEKKTNERIDGLDEFFFEMIKLNNLWGLLPILRCTHLKKEKLLHWNVLYYKTKNRLKEDKEDYKKNMFGLVPNKYLHNKKSFEEWKKNLLTDD